MVSHIGRRFTMLRNALIATLLVALTSVVLAGRSGDVPSLLNATGDPSLTSATSGDIRDQPAEVSVTPNNSFNGPPDGDPPILSNPIWKSIGPQTIEAYPATGPTNWSGRINAIAAHPCDFKPPQDRWVYAAGAVGGVWKSINCGRTWVRISITGNAEEDDDIPQNGSQASGALALDVPDMKYPHVVDVYYGTGDVASIPTFSHGAGLWVYHDGMTPPWWEQIATPQKVGDNITRIVVPKYANPADKVVLVSSWDRGIVRGTPTGSDWSWQVVLGPEVGYERFTALGYSPNSPDRVFAGVTSSGIWRSDNRGLAWTHLSNGLPPPPYAAVARVNLSVCRDFPNVVYASIINPGLVNDGIYKTVDGGNSWTKLDAPIFTTWGHFNNCIAVKPDDPDVCFAAGGNHTPDFVWTVDGGANWAGDTMIKRGVHETEMCLEFGPGPWKKPDITLWLGSSGGVYRTDVPTKSYPPDPPEWPWYPMTLPVWTNCNTNLGIAQLYNLALHPTDSKCLLAGTDYTGAVRYAGKSTIWYALQGTLGSNAPVLIEPYSDAPPNFYGYVATPYFWSVDRYDYPYDGPSTGVTGSWPLASSSSWCRSPMAADLNQASTILVPTTPLWATYDHGASWVPLWHFRTPENPWTEVHSIAVATYPSGSGSFQKIYAGLNLGEIWHSEDGGQNWNVQTGPANFVYHVSDLVMDPGSPSLAYACTEQDGSVYLTTNGGTNWTCLRAGLPFPDPENLHALTLAVDFRTTPPYMYLGTCKGPYRSTDNGQSWVRFGSYDLPNMPVTDLAVDVVNDRLVAATFGLGAWAVDHLSSLSLKASIGAGETRTGPPARLGVVPNPSGAATTVSYCLPRAGNASLKVYDMSGRLAATLASGFHAAGPVSYVLHPNADGLACGVYLIRLTTSDATLTDKLIVQ
jgi:hypothetical protein